MKNIFLHIGLHKTGTSSIQKFLKSNEEFLRSNDYVYYNPSPWPIPFKREPVIDLDTSGLQRIHELPFSNVIISHENFSWLFEVDKVKELYDALVDNNQKCKVIIYLRRQDSLAVSQKQEGTKWIDNSVAYGHSESALPDKLNYFSLNYLDFENKIKLWSSIFGEKNVIVRVLEKSKLLNSNVVDDFCSVVGIPFENVDTSVHVNESISKNKQLLLHLTRPYFQEQTIEKHRFVKMVLSLNDGCNQKLLPTYNEALTFYSSFKESNDRLSCYLGFNIFDEDFSSYSNESDQTLDREYVIKYLSEIILNLISENESLRSKLDENSFEWYRDLALRIENYDIKLALKVMTRALHLKPDAPFVKRKVIEYKAKI